VLAALQNPERVCHRLLLTAEAAKALEPRLSAIARVRKGLPQAEILPRDTLSHRLGTEAVHQGIALLAGPPMERDIGDICRAASLKDRAIVVVLDQVEDPRNVGAVMRSAAAFGALGVIVTERRAPQQTAALAKAASGALETVPLVRVINLVRALGELKEAGFWAAGLDAEGETALDQAQFAAKTALVLGAEGKGLRRLTRESCDLLVRIPMAAEGASLNVSNAAAVALYAASVPRSGSD
jgi:23S rRNA (guanosine2251-2'-O)-methyltransferase